jgi:polysaccharide biosynthesis transport protein
VKGLPLAEVDPKEAVQKIKDHTTVQTVRVQVLDPETGREREVVSAFTVAFESRDPQVAHQGAKWLTDMVLQVSRQNLQERTGVAAKFYANEAERFRTQITGLEERLADFRAKNFGQLPELTNLNMNVMDRTERDIENIELQMRTLRQDRIYLAQQLGQAENVSPDSSNLRQLEAEYARMQGIYDPSHPDFVSLRRRIEGMRSGGAAMGGASLRGQLQAQRAILAETRQRYSDDHPDVKRITRQIETLEARIKSGETTDATISMNPVAVQLRTQVQAIDSQLASLQARGAQLRTKLEQLERRVESTPHVEREYQTLTRDLELARAKYDELLKNQMSAEVGAAAIAGGGSDELRLVQSPGLPAEPAKPARIAILIVGIMFALIAALTAAIVAEGLDQNVRGSRDVRTLLEVAPLAVIPEIQDDATARRLRLQAVTLAGAAMAGGLALLAVVRTLWA